MFLKKKRKKLDSKLKNSNQLVLKRNPIDEPRLHLFRQDYLPNENGEYKQVEINTIAVAFSGFTRELSLLHQDVLDLFKLDQYSNKNCTKMNNPGKSYAEGLRIAHDIYCIKQRQGRKHSSPRVCFLCFKGDLLDLDQRHIDALLRAQDIMTFSVVLETAKIELRDEMQTGGMDLSNYDNEDNSVLEKKKSCKYPFLYVNGIEVSVAYFHTTYSPEHFQNATYWRNRELIEKSCAIKVPSIPTQLAGTKKIQQVLSKPEVLKRFILPITKVKETNHGNLLFNRIMNVFATQVDPYSSEERCKAVVAAAIANPNDWVLKPNREGGGNNIYGRNLQNILLKISEDLSSQNQKVNSQTNQIGEHYILMRKIKSIPFAAELLTKNGEIKSCPQTISELGLFSVFCADGRNENEVNELVNKVAGSFIRTKLATSEEGGVCSGFGFLNTPFFGT